MRPFFLTRIIDKLIAKDLKRQELAGSSLNLPSKAFPCIALSRETSSGGRLIGQLAAKKLHMKFYDKELVNLIAKNTKKRQEIVEALDEKSKSLIENIIDDLRSWENILPEMTYFKQLCRTVLALTEKNPVVFVGRGVNFIIPAERCFRVRVIAPLYIRIQNTIKYEHKNPQKAKETIRQIHFDRKDFTQKYFRKDISNANYYDLVINTEYFSIPQAVNIVVKGYREKFSKTVIQ